jgi:hypothetical protein
MTGEWYGGGDWPPRRAGTTGLPSVGGQGAAGCDHWAPVNQTSCSLG